MSEWNFTLAPTDFAELTPEEFDALWGLLAKVIKNRLRHIQSPIRSALDE